MKRQLNLSAELYGQVLDRLNAQFFTDRPGRLSDLSFLQEDQWLADAAVIDRLCFRKGMWNIQLVFAHCKTPSRFLIRTITAITDLKRARMTAYYMCRMAAKDQRGTLCVSADHFPMPLN